MKRILIRDANYRQSDIERTMWDLLKNRYDVDAWSPVHLLIETGISAQVTRRVMDPVRLELRIRTTRTESESGLWLRSWSTG